MTAPQSPLASFESSAIKILGEAELALIMQQHAQVADRRERVWMVAPKSPLIPFETAAQERLGEAWLVPVLFLRLATEAGDEVVPPICAGRCKDLQTLGRSVTSARRLGGKSLGCGLVKRTRNSRERSETAPTRSAK